MIDYIILGIVALFAGLAIWFILRQKKKGVKCIGCPYAKSCSGNCSGCNSNCGDKE